MSHRTLNILAIETLIKIHRGSKAGDKIIHWLIKTATPSLIGLRGCSFVGFAVFVFTHRLVCSVVISRLGL